MDQALQILADYQVWIYAVLGILLLFYIWRAFLARREGARSIFKLEQEQAHTRYRRNVIIAVVIILLIAVVFALLYLTQPSSQPTVVVEPEPTETTGPLAVSTLTATPPPATITPTPTATQVRPTRPVRPTDTVEAEVTETPVVRPASCPNPGIQISSPGTNQAVQGNLAVRGTANTESFDYYKVEVGPGSKPGDSQWTVVGQLHREPVAGGVLETFNSGAYAPGTYTLRLVVVDATGNFPPPCTVTINVQR
jgi:hypothetical protein